MRYFALLATIAAMAVSIGFASSPVHAQLPYRSWVSATGDDQHDCGRTTPCASFAAAISKTNQDGEIDCLDAGEYGTVTIQKSITIDCHEVNATINSQTVTGITINFDAFDSLDTFKTVNLRNLTIQGQHNAITGIHIIGAGAGSFVTVVDCLLNNNDVGISDARGRGALIVNNTTIRNNRNNFQNFGITIASNDNGSRRATISNTQLINTTVGVSVGANSEVMIEHSVVSNNLTAGLMVTSSSGVLVVDSTTISHNGNGIQNSGGTVHLSNSNLALNTAAVSGAVLSFTNNRFSNNGSVGTITPIGTAANPTGQQ
jgi:hypothetical protein